MCSVSVLSKEVNRYLVAIIVNIKCTYQTGEDKSNFFLNSVCMNEELLLL